MKFAIISDIHGNLEALTAVLEDIERRGIEHIVCLGDVVGYGASPRECLDLVMQHTVVSLCGNHDHAVLYEPTNFNAGAEKACYWTRQAIEDDCEREGRNRRLAFLGQLPIRYELNDMLFVHASPRKPINEYLFPDDVYANPQKLLLNFERMDKMTCFVGHTHVPGVFVDDPFFEPPDEMDDRRYVIGEEKTIINVGSVGQPRDRDPRASYAIVEDNIVEFVRLPYDIETAAAKIRENPCLDDFLGTRLFEGK
jgi:diadenosine tetraphosphatase ApaH/serine/threonine PP2A family protein phosphatase